MFEELKDVIQNLKEKADATDVKKAKPKTQRHHPTSSMRRGPRRNLPRARDVSVKIEHLASRSII